MKPLYHECINSKNISNYVDLCTLQPGIADLQFVYSFLTF